MLLKVGQSKQEQLKADTLASLQNTMLSVAGNTELLLRVVAGGPVNWRNVFLNAHRGLAVDEHIANSMFGFFCQQVQLRFGQGVSAGEVLDHFEPPPPPPSQREIDEGWEVESWSSEEGRRYFYGVDGHPETLVKQLRH